MAAYVLLHIRPVPSHEAVSCTLPAGWCVLAATCTEDECACNQHVLGCLCLPRGACSAQHLATQALATFRDSERATTARISFPRFGICFTTIFCFHVTCACFPFRPDFISTFYICVVRVCFWPPMFMHFHLSSNNCIISYV